jgi:hypothetical protein
MPNVGYGPEIASLSQFVSFPAATGAPVSYLGSILGNTIYAGDFGPGGVYYCVNDNDNTLYTADLFTGILTPIALLTGLINDQIITSMTYHAPSNTMYAGSTECGTISYLYTCNLTTGVLSVVGPITNAKCLINLAINNAGELYGLDITNDNLVSINTGTGAGTVVGPIGFNANYAQGADIDDATGILYLTAFNADAGQGEYRSVNLATGSSTLIAVFPGALTEIDAYGIYSRPQSQGIPLSPWAIAIGIVLITVSTVFRFKRLG